MENQLSSSGIFPRTYIIADSAEDPETFGRTEHRIWKFWRSDYLHVNVQRHWMDKKRERRELYFEFRKSQDVREEILARTLNVSWSWRRKEVVWKSRLQTWGKKEFHRTAIQGNKSSNLYKCQCLESWNPEMVERKRNQTLQCGCFEHRTLIPNYSLSESAQYLRSSLRLEWTVRFWGRMREYQPRKGPHQKETPWTKKS